MEDSPGSFVRWQTIVISQLTYSINLILGLSIATIGFLVTLLLNRKFETALPGQRFEFCLALHSLFLVTLSSAFGIWVVVNRLKDFRETMRAARKKEDGKPDEEIEPHRILYRKLGERTWCLFWWQIGTFGIGIFLAILAVAILVITT